MFGNPKAGIYLSIYLSIYQSRVLGWFGWYDRYELNVTNRRRRQSQGV